MPSDPRTSARAGCSSSSPTSRTRRPWSPRLATAASPGIARRRWAGAARSSSSGAWPTAAITTTSSNTPFATTARSPSGSAIPATIRPPTPAEPHTHNALWYVDTELTPSGANLGESAYWLTHVEPASSTNPGGAADGRTPITVEGARRWDERDFATLLIEDGVTNAFGNPLGYEFSPLRNSLSRHSGPLETWTQNDVYVTRAHPNELGWIASWTQPDNYLMTY